MGATDWTAIRVQLKGKLSTEHERILWIYWSRARRNLKLQDNWAFIEARYGGGLGKFGLIQFSDS